MALAVASWAVLAWTHAVPGMTDRFGTLRGVDFLQFYAAGWFVAAGRVEQLYDWEVFAGQLPALVPGIGDVLFLPLYPPQVALAFAPLGRLPYLAALGVWTAVSSACYLLAVRLTLRALPTLSRVRFEAWVLALGFPPFLQLIAHGQVGAPAVLGLALALIAFRADRPVLFGLALGALLFKPQFATFALVAMLLAPSWRLAAGLVLGGGIQAAAVVLALGAPLLLEYVEVLGRVMASASRFEPKLHAMHSLRGALELLVGQNPLATGLWVLACLGVVWRARRAWRAHASRTWRFAVLGLAGILLNPHLYVYDLVLLAVPLGCLAAWLLQEGADPPAAPGLAYLLVWLPLLGPLAAITHVQLTSPAMAALLWVLGASHGRTATTQDRSR